MSDIEMEHLVTFFGIICALFLFFGSLVLVSSNRKRGNRRFGSHGSTSSDSSWSSYISDSSEPTHSHDCSSHDVSCSSHD